MNFKYVFLLVSFLTFFRANSQENFIIEAESFKNYGGWVVDQQFYSSVGSSYLMAHGMGRKVLNAETKVTFSTSAEYYVYARTYNWISPWSEKEGPGRFKVMVGDNLLQNSVGGKGNRWEWQLAGKVFVEKGESKIALCDLTGFNGRCDALFFSTKELSSYSDKYIETLRDNATDSKLSESHFDFVVVGGGIAGMCAAVSAARLGVKVALVHDRPVFGGNNSSEVRVHMGGRICIPPYPMLGNLVNEFAPIREGNAKPADFYEDERKEQFLRKESNLTLFPSYYVNKVNVSDKEIVSVEASHITSGKRVKLSGKLFADCTGDGTIGALAGADYMMGREPKSLWNEGEAPVERDSLMMGTSIQWYSGLDTVVREFPIFDYNLNFNDKSVELVEMGEWTWETGMNKSPIMNAEEIRDYGLAVVFSNWSYIKNKLKPISYKNRYLQWVGYISGKRESRRLVGDYILTQNDLMDYKAYDDATASTSWSIDLHYPDTLNSCYFKDNEFKSIAKHIPIHYYPIPYRCLYSRNINNLFMAGRNISVSHVALGTTRVMRTTGMLGEVVGMAASICIENNINPRCVYWDYLQQLKELMKKGVGIESENIQKYNLGATLGTNYSEFNNNRRWKDFEGDDILIKNSSIIKYGDTYYWYGENENGFVCYSSNDLYNWYCENDFCIVDNAKNNPYDINILYNKNLNVFFAYYLRKNDKEKSYLCIAKSDNPTKGFELVSEKECSCDAINLFEYKGRAYIVHLEQDGKRLHLSELDSSYINSRQISDIEWDREKTLPIVLNYNNKLFLISSKKNNTSLVYELENLNGLIMKCVSECFHDGNILPVSQLYNNGNYIIISDNNNSSIWLPFDISKKVINYKTEWEY